jgi:VanZ family protein
MWQKFKLKLYLNAYLPIIIWASLIYFFSSLQTLPSPEILWFDFIIKKTAHIFMYAVLAILLLRGLNLTFKSKNKKKLLIITLLICLIYAISDELHQSFVANRTASIRDVGFDLLGSSLVLIKKLGYI